LSVEGLLNTSTGGDTIRRTRLTIAGKAALCVSRESGTAKQVEAIAHGSVYPLGGSMGHGMEAGRPDAEKRC